MTIERIICALPSQTAVKQQIKNIYQKQLSCRIDYKYPLHLF